MCGLAGLQVVGGIKRHENVGRMGRALPIACCIGPRYRPASTAVLEEPIGRERRALVSGHLG